MGSRLDFQAKLEELASNVYFQPPADIEMAYPCIVYKRDQAETMFADNGPYRNTKRYQVTVIDRDPDSDIPDAIAALPLTEHRRFYTVKNLNHDVFVVYF